MNIDIYNYESYFWLYRDNELDAGGRQAVEKFVLDHPHLKIELDNLQQFTLVPDPDVVYANKDALLKYPAGVDRIDAGNHTTFFMLYADNELDAAGKLAVEQFVAGHPQHRKAFEQYQSAKLLPDYSVTCSNKKGLYRHEKVKPAYAWWPAAAAAVCIFIAGALWQLMHQAAAPQITVFNTIPAPFHIDSSKGTQPGNTYKRGAAGHRNAIVAGQPLTPPPGIAVAGQYTKIKGRPLLKPSGQVKAAIEGYEKPVAAKLHAPGATQEDTGPAGVSIGTVAAKPLLAADAVKLNIPVKTGPVTSLALATEQTPVNLDSNAMSVSDDRDEPIYLANIPINRKHALRGLFRKASRFINQTTAFASGHTAGVHIGNVEIALQ